MIGYDADADDWLLFESMNKGKKLLKLNLTIVVYGCGSTLFNKLGIDAEQGNKGRRQDVPIPFPFESKQIITFIACSEQCSFFINKYGHLFACGRRDHCIGIPHCSTQQDSNSGVVEKPTLVRALKDHFIVQFSCSDAHCVALTREGLVFSWGVFIKSVLTDKKGEIFMDNLELGIHILKSNQLL